MLFLALGNVSIKAFDARFGNGDAACADELQHTTQCIEPRKEFDDIFRYACILHDGIGGIHLNDTGIVLAHNAGDVLIGKHHRCGQLQQGGLEDEYLVVDEAVGLQHINLLLNLLGQHLRHFLLAIAGDRVFVYAWCR